MMDGRPGAPVGAVPKAEAELALWQELPEPHRSRFQALAEAVDQVTMLRNSANQDVEPPTLVAWRDGVNDALSVVVQLALAELGWPLKE